ncbi:hypothetical protein I4U23_010923 [Adineta vaga]|nr:hypothetical protein I4U23_010923 [Adineta vaga]
MATKNQVEQEKLAARFSQRPAHAIVGHGSRGALPPSWEIGNQIKLKDAQECPAALSLDQSKEKCNTGIYITSWNTIELTEPLRYERDATTGNFRSIRVRDIVNGQNVERFGPWIESGCSLLPTTWSNLNEPPPPSTVVAMELNPTDQSTNTELFNNESSNQSTISLAINHFWHMDFKDTLKIVGTLLVPLVLGIATTVLSVQHAKLSEKNRENDLKIAWQERQQDAYLADQSENERILATYLHDISMMLLDKNMTLDKFHVVSSIIRAKTLTTLLQLDSKRKRQVIIFLYETKLIAKESDYPSINLFDAELDNLDMNLPKLRQSQYSVYNVLQIQLRGVSLINSSFRYRNLDFSDFSQADLSSSDFSWTQLPHVDFRFALVNDVDFTKAKVSKAVFTYANLNRSNISDEQLSTVLTFQGAILPNGTTASLKNLLINGDAEYTCSHNTATLPYGWIVQNGKNGQIDIIVNLRHLTSNGTVLEKITICSRSTHDEYCDHSALLYQSPYFTLYRDLISNGKIETKSTRVEILFKLRTINNYKLLEKADIASCDNIAFHIYLSP